MLQFPKRYVAHSVMPNIDKIVILIIIERILILDMFLFTIEERRVAIDSICFFKL